MTPVALLEFAWELQELAERAMQAFRFQLALKKRQSVHLSDHRYEIRRWQAAGRCAGGADCRPTEKGSCHFKACAVHYLAGLKKITRAKSSHTVSK